MVSLFVVIWTKKLNLRIIADMVNMIIKILIYVDINSRNLGQ